jgi:RNA polymerase sigma-70 factor (ECF subfamily)
MQASASDDLVQLNRRFRPALMAFFLRRLANHAEAEDLTQEVFSRLTTMTPGELNQADAYIFQIAANLLRDRARRATTRKADAHASLDAPTELAAQGVAHHPELVEDRGPERVLLAQESLAEAMRALGELSERTRHIYILHRLEKMRHKDIAALLGLSVSAVEKHVIRAVAHLTERCGKR